MLISSTLSTLGQELQLNEPHDSTACGTEEEAITPPSAPGALCRKVLYDTLVLASTLWMPLYKDIDYMYAA